MQLVQRVHAAKKLDCVMTAVKARIENRYSLSYHPNYFYFESYCLFLHDLERERTLLTSYGLL